MSLDKLKEVVACFAPLEKRQDFLMRRRGEEVRNAIKCGHNAEEIAEAIGVSVASVYRINRDAKKRERD